MRLLIATGNASKAREFRALLSTVPGFDLIDLSQLPSVEAPEESGATFCENAALKATFYAQHFNSLALADDSGLEADALERKPGIFSARWAALHDAGHGDVANNQLLLQQLADTPDERRGGRFVCCLALSDASGRILQTVERTWEGRILREVRGIAGFGYDGLFRADGESLSNGELDPAEKQRRSHRGQALRIMVDRMVKAGLDRH